MDDELTPGMRLAMAHAALDETRALLGDAITAKNRAQVELAHTTASREEYAMRAVRFEEERDEARAEAARLRAAAKRVLEADMRGVRDLDALNALEDAAGFSQQGQDRCG
jgi:hypothetical protein